MSTWTSNSICLEESIMICAKCGGTIHINEACTKCGIAYDEMINSIEHPEIKRLFKTIEKRQNNHEDILIEESLMACELLNSSMILPIRLNDKGMDALQIPGPDGKTYLAIFTDIDEFKLGNVEMTPVTNSWSLLMDLLNDNLNGFIINVFGEAVIFTRQFLDVYFG